jgi:hypothetical protein
MSMIMNAKSTGGRDPLISIGHPVLNALRNPFAGDLRTSDGFDPAGCVLIWIHYRHVCRLSRRGSAARFQSALVLIVKPASKYVLGMQVSRRQGVAQEDEFLWRAEQVRTAAPEMFENRSVEVFQVCWSNDQRSITLSSFGLYLARMEKRMDALIAVVIGKYFNVILLLNLFNLVGVVPIKRPMRLQQDRPVGKFLGQSVA